MHRLLATTLLVCGLVVATIATPAGAHWMADSGIFSGDTGDDTSDTSAAADDSGTNGEGDSGAMTDTGSDTGDWSDTGGQADTGDTEQGKTEVFSAAELANDKGGCSTTGGTQGQWLVTLVGLLLVSRRRRD